MKYVGSLSIACNMLFGPSYPYIHLKLHTALSHVSYSNKVASCTMALIFPLLSLSLPPFSPSLPLPSLPPFSLSLPIIQMYALYKDPEGKSVFDRTKPTDRPQASNPDSVEQSGRLKGDSYRMEEKVRNLAVLTRLLSTLTL